MLKSSSSGFPSDTKIDEIERLFVCWRLYFNHFLRLLRAGITGGSHTYPQKDYRRKTATRFG